MKRRTLDLIFSIGGGAVALLLLVLGLVLNNQADFADDYVRTQLAAQRISFTPADKLAPEEQRAECLVTNAGKPLETGKQAECYANEYIGLHVTEINDGKTYAESSTQSRALKAQADAATKADPGSEATKKLVADAAGASAKVDTLFKGETLRGLLLTSYGFSIFGERAGQAAMVCFLLAGVLGLATIAGFVHAFRTPRDEVVLAAHD